MSKKDYKWKRFWCPRSGSINLADAGYLPEPSSDWGRACNPELVSFVEIVDLPCLVFLGEAGMGKTTAMEVAHKQIYEQSHCWEIPSSGKYQVLESNFIFVLILGSNELLD